MSSSQGASAGTLPTHSAVTSPAVTDHGGVRRHHTISSASRSARVAPRHTSDDDQGNDQDLWKDDEVVDQDWVGGVGAVGEKSLLHRQSSLPTKYHRGEPDCADV
jgi:YTH domain-containing family protein